MLVSGQLAAPPPGFEPGPSEPKSEVLPLHHGGQAPILTRPAPTPCRASVRDRRPLPAARPGPAETPCRAWNTGPRARSGSHVEDDTTRRPDRGIRGMTTDSAIRPAADADTAPVDHVQALRIDRPAQFPRPRRHPAVRAVPHRGRPRGAGADLPAARAGLRAVPVGPDPAADHAGGDVHRVRLLLLLLHLLGRARPPVRRRRGRAAGPRRRTPSSSRSRATTATCCSTSSSAASAAWASSRR